MINIMQQNTNHKGARHLNYFLNIALCLGILMLRTDVKTYFLLYSLLTITPEHIISEESIITVQVFDLCGIFLP